MFHHIEQLFDNKFNFRLPKITRQTLPNNYGKSRIVCIRTSSEAVLGKSTEEKLEKWILECYRRGFHMLDEGLIYSAKTIVEQLSDDEQQLLSFNNNTLGKGWYSGFRRRHPRVLEKYDESLLNIKTDLNEWFTSTEEILDEDNVRNALSDPARIYILDELILKFDSKNGLMFWNKKNTAKETNTSELSFLFAANAVGDVAPPFVISKSDLSFHFTESDNWRSESSDDGLINCEVFFDYMVNTFYPYLTKTSSLPVVIFFGCEFPYLSTQFCDFCQSKNISLICLPRNSKTIESINTLFYNELNKDWDQLELDSNIDQISLEIYVLSILQDSIEEGIFQRSIIQKFMKNGIYPFNSQNRTRSSLGNVTNIQNRKRHTAIEYMESKIPSDILSQFRYCHLRKVPWKGIVDYTALYELWLAIMEDDRTDESDDKELNEIDTDDDEEVCVKAESLDADPEA